mmetsp:Transcript_50392/g.109425  ORF Transcript_50392/g.109425 Transcript_50392/m.109425 type:complete len:95 (+) Transcript_50392:890-1174(+)
MASLGAAEDTIGRPLLAVPARGGPLRPLRGGRGRRPGAIPGLVARVMRLLSSPMHVCLWRSFCANRRLAHDPKVHKEDSLRAFLAACGQFTRQR